MTTKFKVGDRVRVNNNIPSRWWFKPGDIGVITGIDADPVLTYEGNALSFIVAFDAHDGDTGYVSARQIELVARPAKAKPEKTLDLGVEPKPTEASDHFRPGTQDHIILSHLLSGKSITAMESMIVYGIARLSSCISHIRNLAGYDIITEDKRDEMGRRYSRYKLA